MIINSTKGQQIEFVLSNVRKKLISHSIILCFFLLILSRLPYSKDTYLEDLSEFVIEVEQNYQSCIEDNRTVKGQEYEEHVGKSYNKFCAKLTNEDKKQIGKLTAKYQTIIIKCNAKKID